MHAAPSLGPSLLADWHDAAAGALSLVPSSLLQREFAVSLLVVAAAAPPSQPQPPLQGNTAHGGGACLKCYRFR